MTTMPGLSWGALILRGILLIGLGVFAFIAPQPTLVALIALFGAFMLVDGVLAVIAGVTVPSGPRWWIVLAGIAGIAVGVLTFVSPSATAVAIVLFVAVWAIIIGVGQIVTAWRLRSAIEGEWIYYVSGVISILFGAFLIVFPGAGVLSLLWLIGFYAIFFGVMHVYTGWMLRERTKAAPAVS